MRFSFFILLISLFYSEVSFTQVVPSFVWARAGISVGADRFNDVAQDQNGFVYAVGDFDEDLIIGTDTFPIISSGNSCGLITKWDPNGVYQWGIALGTFGYPINVSNIIISDQNEIYVAGRFSGTCYMGTDTLGNDVNSISNGAIRSYISKFNTNGELIWTKKFDGTSNNWVYNLEFDNLNHLVVVGDYFSDIDFGNGQTMTAYQQLDAFAAWFNTDGTCVSSFGYQGYGEERMYDIAFDSQGNYAIGGAFNDSIFIGNDTLIANGTGDAIITYYNSNGILQWYDQFGGSQSSFINSDMVTEVEFDSNNDIYATGIFRDTLFFGQDSLESQGNIDSFLIKYNPQGQKLLYNTLGGSSISDEITGLKLDGNNNLYMTVTGNNMSYNDTTYNFYQGLDIHVIKMNPNLEIEWLKRAGSQYSDYVGDLSINESGDVYVACQPGDINPIEFDTITIVGSGSMNWYECVLAKLSTHGPVFADLNEYSSLSSEYYIYPNPSKSHIQISGLIGEQEVLITDTNGKVLLNDTFNSSQKINVSLLPSGVYFVLLPESYKSFKLIRE